MNSKKTDFIAIVTWLIALLTMILTAPACTGTDLSKSDPELRSVEISLELSDGAPTKGLQVSDGLIADLNIYVFNSYGDIQYHSYQSTTTFSAKLWSNMRYDVYVVANAGRSIDVASLSALTASVISVANPSAIVGSRGQLPMSGSATGLQFQGNRTVQISLTRCISKVKVIADVSGLSNTTISFTGLKLRNVTNFTSLFASSRATSSSQVFPEGDSLTGSELSGLTGSGVTLHCFPNAQGELLPNNSDRKNKVLTGLPAYQGLCTYLELTGTYEGPSMHGTICYRIYLGANDFTDFSLERNKLYTVRIQFRGDALSETSWRVDASLLEPNYPKVADFFYSDGSWSTAYNSSKTCIGVVFDVDMSRQEGNRIWICALRSYQAAWSTRNESVTGVTTTTFYATAREDYDGQANTEAIGDWRYYSLSNYPAAYRCLTYSTSGYGTGRWCLGSLGQMYSLLNSNEARSSNPSSGTVNWSIRKAGGTGLDRDYSSSNIYWTSTMVSTTQAYSISFGLGSESKSNKSTNGYVRPILQL